MIIMAFNASAMEQVRAETEAVMSGQASLMETTAAENLSAASNLESEASSLDASAAAQEVIAATAMKTITRRGPNGESISVQVPDTAARAAAAAAARSMRA
ncbi:MAG: hypothetical protein FWE32_07440 [Oscillospiraceae bacterium]|nr:hypothetical protein [Oscillospiraceae bacterium]